MIENSLFLYFQVFWQSILPIFRWEITNSALRQKGPLAGLSHFSIYEYWSVRSNFKKKIKCDIFKLPPNCATLSLFLLLFGRPLGAHAADETRQTYHFIHSKWPPTHVYGQILVPHSSNQMSLSWRSIYKNKFVKRPITQN